MFANKTFGQVSNFSCNSQWITATASPTNDPCVFFFRATGEIISPSWTTPFGNFTGNNISITFPSPGSYPVTFTTTNGFTCTGTVVVSNACSSTPPPTVTMIPRIDCCQLIFGMTSSASTVMGWQMINQNGQVLFSNSSGFAVTNWDAHIFDVVVCDPDDRVQILSNGVVVNTIDLSDFGIEGRWIGGDLFVCDNTTFTQAINANLLPNTVFDGNFQCSPNLYFNGTIVQDRPQYTINNANECMGQGSRLQIGTGQAQVAFTTRNSTYQGDENCDQMWWGMEAVDRTSVTLSDQTTIRDAMYGLRIENYNTIENDISISIRRTNFENNFIGLRATGGSYQLLQFQGNTFRRNFSRDLKNLFPTTPCPTVNDLADAETPIHWQRDFFFNNGGVFAGIYVDGRPRYSTTSTNGARYSGRNGAHFTMPLTGTIRNTFRDIANGIFVNNCNSRIVDCDFKNILESSYPVPAGWQPIDQYAGYGIRLLDGVGSRTLNAGSGVFGSSTMRTNTFDFVDKGVYAASYARGSQAIVRNSTMTNMGTGVTVVGDLIQVGDATWVSGNFSQVSILDNQITTVNNPIRPDDAISITDRIEQATRTVVSRNNITLNGGAPEVDALGIAFWGNDGNNSNVPSIISNNTINLNQGEAGIKINNTERLTISDNTVLVRGANTTSSFPAGIRMEGARQSALDCNDVTYLSEVPMGNTIQNGLYVNDNPRMRLNMNTITGGNVLTFVEGANPESNITQNNFVPLNQAFTGLFYGSDPAGSNNAPAFTGAQFDKNNRWFSNNFTSNLGAINWLFDGTEPYFVPGNPGTLPYHPRADVSDWFRQEQSLTGLDCFCGVPCGPVDPCGDCLIAPVNQPFFVQLANGALDVSIPPGTRHQLRSFLFDALSKDPALRYSNQDFEIFYNTEATSALGQLYTAKQILTDGMITETVLNQLDALYLAIEAKQSEIDLIVEQLDTAPEDAALLSALEGKQQEMDALLSSASDIWDQVADLEDQAKSEALTILEAISSSETPISNEVFALTSLLLPESQSASQLASLEALANDCATEAGNAVYLARTLWFDHSGTYPSHLVCSAAKGRSKADNDFAVHVSPNPSQGLFNVVLPTLGQIQIFDLVGSLVQEQTGTPGQNQVRVTVQQSGIYLLKYVGADGSTYTDRLLIHKSN